MDLIKSQHCCELLENPAYHCEGGSDSVGHRRVDFVRLILDVGAAVDFPVAGQAEDYGDATELTQQLYQALVSFFVCVIKCVTGQLPLRTIAPTKARTQGT